MILTLSLQMETIPDVASIDLQPEIQYFMRGYLLDFLIEAHGAFKLLPETLFLAVNLLDRYCSKRVVYSRHYQLVGCASLLLAAKYGDKKDRVPLLKELEVMCQSVYTADMIRQMEWHVLLTLDWQIGHTTVDHFIQVSLINVEYDEQLEHMTLFISELALYCRDFISVRSSAMATAALTLARYILGRNQLATIEENTEHEAIVIRLSSHLPHATRVLVKKYSHASLSNVSEIVHQFLQRQIAYAEHQTCMADTPTFEEYSASASIRDLPASMHTPRTPPARVIHTAKNVPKDYTTPPITPDEAIFAENYLEIQGSRMHESMETPTRLPAGFAKTEPIHQLEWIHYDPATYNS